MDLIKGLIFDFDGLILETEEPIFQSWQELYQSYGCELAFDDWTKIIGSADGPFDPVEELERQVGHALDWGAIEPERRRRELALIGNLKPLPGVAETLQAARRLGLKVALASSSPCAWVTGHLERLGLLQYFDCVMASDDVRITKPDPELFVVALAGLGLEAGQAVVFEDSPNGVLAARRAGLFTVAVPTRMTEMLPLEQADLRLSSLAELPLEELLRRVEQMQAQAMQRMGNGLAGKSDL
jgi:HAD superfamily hydrolase (TIGR01509 family)